jgi:signal transduction histidine kinase
MTGPDLASLPAHLPVGVAVFDRTGTVAWANPELERLLGAADLVGRALDDVLGQPGALAALAEAAAHPDLPDAELACTVDGRELWLTSCCRGVADGRADQLVAVFVDSTARHAAATEHAERTNALQLLAEFPEKNPGPVGRLSRDGTVVMANAAARRFIGQGDIRGRCWIDICPGMNWEVWSEVLDGQAVIHEAEHDGVFVQFTHVVADAGDLVFVYGANVTARRREEQLVAAQAARLAEVARFPEMNPGPVLRMGPDAKLLMANAAARKVFGEELIGCDWRDLCPGIETSWWMEVLDADDVRFHEARIGERAFVFAHRFDPASQLMFVFGADVTAQKTAERALRQSERMATLGTLAAGVAHELNNPAAATRRAAEHLTIALARLEDAHRALDDAGLSPAALAVLRELEARARTTAGRVSALSSVERSDLEAEAEDWLDDHGVDDAWDLAPALVAQGLGVDDLDRLAGALGPGHIGVGLAWASAAHRAQALAHEIGQGSARISEIVQAMKSYSYLGQAPVQAVDVHEGLDSTLVILRNKLKQGIDVRREYGADLPPVAAYGSELNQVWTNLLDNAADAMGGQGSITIRTSRDGDQVVVEVVDDGPGIPEGIQQHVFDPFFTTKEPGKGTGLGLSTSYSIITEKHRGSLAVTSRPGETRFTVRLPIDTPQGGTA